MDKTSFCLRSFYKEHSLKIFGIFAFAMTFICAVLSTLSRTLFFDEIGYYQNHTIIPKLFITACACSALLIAVFCFAPKIRINPSEQSTPLPVRIGAMILAVGFAILSLESLNTVTVATTEYGITWNLQSFNYLILPLIIRLFTTIHLIRTALIKDPSGAFNVLGSTCVIIFAVSAIASTYFNTQIPMNAPNVTLLYLALLSTMLLFTNEARIGLGEDKGSFHAFSAAMTTLFGASFCISEAFVYLDLINDPKALISTITVNSYFSIIFFITVFSATRLASICFIKPAAPIEEADNAEQNNNENDNEEAEASEDVIDTQADDE